MKVIIRNAKDLEIDNIAEIYVSSWRKAFSKFLLSSTINKINYEEKAKFFKELISKEEGNVFVAENKKTKEICGYIIYKKLNKNSIEIISFYVSRECIGTSVGEKLLNHIKIYCKENYISTICLWTFKRNNDSIKFYKALGFFETGFQRESRVESGQIEVQYILKSL